MGFEALRLCFGVTDHYVRAIMYSYNYVWSTMYGYKFRVLFRATRGEYRTLGVRAPVASAGIRMKFNDMCAPSHTAQTFRTSSDRAVHGGLRATGPAVSSKVRM